MFSQFPCDKCGLCCKRVSVAEETVFLDRGDGVCKHHDEESKLCSIYESRPEVCRVNEYYTKHYSKRISWDNFVQENLAICDNLKSLDV